MKEITIFYAWQSDRPNNVNRGFIEKALNEAVSHLNASSSGLEIKIDQDTRGVAGTPPITQTILDKIEHCDIFLPDLTLVARVEGGKKEGKLYPNANVLIEYGYALREKGHASLMPVMNTAYGIPDDLPFDMSHLRHPIQYTAKPDDIEKNRRDERTRLIKQFIDAITVAIKSLKTNKIISPITQELRQWAERKHLDRLGPILSLTPVPLIGGPKLVMHLIPASSKEELREINFDLIKDQSSRFIPYDFQRQASRSDAQSWLFYDPAASMGTGKFIDGRFSPRPGDSRWFIEISRYGEIELVSMLDTIGMPDDQDPITIEGSMLEALIVRSAEQLVQALKVLGLNGPVIVHTSLLEVQDCHLLYGRAHGRFHRQPVIVPEVILDNLEPPLAEKLRPLLNAIWRAAGWTEGSPSYAQGTWVGYTG